MTLTWRQFHKKESLIRTTINEHKLDKVYNETVKKVTEDYESLHFNTAVSQMMIFVNEAYKQDSLPVAYVEGFIKLLNPIAPHMTEELWSYLHADESIAYAEWPTYDESALVADEVELILQVNGKLRGHVTVAADADRDAITAAAKQNENVQKQLDGAEPKKVIVVPGKLINFVI